MFEEFFHPKCRLLAIECAHLLAFQKLFGKPYLSHVNNKATWINE